MKQFWKEVRLAGIMGLVVPGIVLGTAVSLYDAPAVIEQPTEPTTIQATAAAETQIQIPVQTGDGTVVQMDLNDYLTGVVLAEMPASFEVEALKAQAVVARTYTIRAQERGGKHEAAAVCTDSTCCQGYIPEADYLAKGGSQESIDKMRAAVTGTADLVLTYEGKLIEATYFSCSGGSTEDAVAVWGTDVPYLQAVSSPGEENAAHYTDTVTFTAEKFASALGLNLSGDPASWLGKVTYTAGGGVNTMVIGGVTFNGTELRAALGLRSTAFTMVTGKDTVTINTKGYGHRVGMSQYGADAMAALGSTYAEILAHYYQGTTLVNWGD